MIVAFGGRRHRALQQWKMLQLSKDLLSVFLVRFSRVVRTMRQIRQSIFDETGCTASAGASNNMLLARCASYRILSCRFVSYHVARARLLRYQCTSTYQPNVRKPQRQQ